MLQQSELSELFERAQSGDRDAENQIADFFFPKAIQFAKKKMGTGPSPMLDHEDLAVSALHSLFRCVRDGKVEYRGDQLLKGLLNQIIVNKAKRYWRYELADKRDRRKVIEQDRLENNSDGLQLAEFAVKDADSNELSDQSLDLSPNEQGQFDEVLQHLETELHGLFKTLAGSLREKPRKMLLLMLEKEMTNQEMAAKLDCSLATVGRYRDSLKRKIERMFKNEEGEDSGNENLES